jgi:hypothetical protein
MQTPGSRSCNQADPTFATGWLRFRAIIHSGFKYKYGPLTSATVGDKIIAYDKVSSVSRRGYSFQEIGKLTVVQTFDDYAIMQKDGEFKVDEATAFLKE